jgi:Protoporphyrinogen oxidase
MESTGINHSVRVAVVGGGISGLTAAYKLLNESQELGLGVDVRLFEAAPRFGGVIETVRGVNFVMEAGPDSFFYREKKAASNCARSWGLANI